MKANEAPEKIYLERILCSNEVYDTWKSQKTISDDIEYVRKDAFIDKACDFLNKNISEIERYEPAIRDYEVIDVHCKHYDSKKDFIEDFKKFIEEIEL